MNLMGLVAALSAFAGIWFGHVAVRKLEFISPRIEGPMAFFILAGLAFEALSVWVDSALLSAAFGILAITLLWDAFEMVRQQNRIRKGHAPANPANPRHAKILAEPGSLATLTDLLKQE